MATVDDELRELLRERAVPPPAPVDRYDAVRRRARARVRGRAVGASAVTVLAVLAAVGLPMALRPDPAGVPAAVPSHPPAGPLAHVASVTAAGSTLWAAVHGGGCHNGQEPQGTAWLEDGTWHVAAWFPARAPSGPGQACPSNLVIHQLSVPLPRAYDGEPVVDESSGRTITVNGGEGFRLPTYLPPGYSARPGDAIGGSIRSVTLVGPYGPIELRQGERSVGTIRDMPGWPYDVLDRPEIDGSRGTLIRWRNDRGNTMLAWLDRDGRGYALQVFSTELDPQELVRVARSIG